MVRGYQAIIGEETRAQILVAEGRLQDDLIAPIGGGSNAIGLFPAFWQRPRCPARGGGDGRARLRQWGDSRVDWRGATRHLHGSRSMVLQDPAGQIIEAHSVSAGLDYPAVGPEHAWLAESGRARYTSVTDNEALAAFNACTRLEASCRPWNPLTRWRTPCRSRVQNSRPLRRASSW